MPHLKANTPLPTRTAQRCWFVLFALLFIGLPGITAAEVYRWVDEAGNVHFGDRPHENAEEVEIKPQLPGSSPGAGGEAEQAGAEGGTERAEVDAYSEIAISQPGRNQLIRSSEGVLEVELALTPDLGRGHRVRLLMDGAQPIPPFANTKARINDVPGGRHSLMASVVNEDGDEMIRSRIINFTMRR